MANYNLVVNSKFLPFSFLEYIAPFLLYKQEYEKLENLANDLSVEAGIWGVKADEANDKDTHKIYTDYYNEVKNASDALALGKMGPNLRRHMMGLKRKFASTIGEIQNRVARREEDIKRQYAISDKTNGRTVFSRDARTTSLDDYGKGIPDFEQVNLDTVYKEGYDGARAMSSRYFNTREGRAFLDLYHMLTKVQGLSPELATVALSESGHYPEFDKFIRDTLSKNKVGEGSPFSMIDLNRIKLALIQGMNTGIIYNEASELRDNKDYLNPLQTLQYEAALQQLLGEQEKEKEKAKLAINPANIYSSREKTAMEKKYTDDIKKYSKYFDEKDGVYTLNKKGWDAYFQDLEIPTDYGTATSSFPKNFPYKGTKKTSAFKLFLDSIGLKAGELYPSAYGPNQAKAAGKLWGNYIKNTSESLTAKYDALKTTEYVYKFDNSDLKDIKSIILTASRGRNLQEVDFDPKTKQFMPTGESLSLSDLNSDGWEVTDSRMSPYLNYDDTLGTLSIKDADGVVKRYKTPAGINIVNLDRILNKMIRAWKYGEVLNTKKLEGKDATPYELLRYQGFHDDALQDAYKSLAELWQTNRTRTLEHVPLGQ